MTERKTVGQIIDAMGLELEQEHQFAERAEAAIVIFYGRDDTVDQLYWQTVVHSPGMNAERASLMLSKAHQEMLAGSTARDALLMALRRQMNKPRGSARGGTSGGVAASSGGGGGGDPSPHS